MHLFWKHIEVLSSCYCRSLSLVQLFATPWTAARQASLSLTKSRRLLKPMSVESVMPSNCFILCCPLLLLPSIFPSIRVFANELALLIRRQNYWSFSFNISPSNEYSKLISFRIDWFDLLAVQRTLKSLLQYHSSKASVICPQPSLWSNSQIYGYWKNYSVDYADFCWQSNVSAFWYAV